MGSVKRTPFWSRWIKLFPSISSDVWRGTFYPFLWVDAQRLKAPLGWTGPSGPAWPRHPSPAPIFPSLGPHDGRLPAVLWPDAGGPVADGQEVLWVEWVSLQGVDGAVVSWEGTHDLLGRRLALAVAGDDDALLGAHHELGRLWRGCMSGRLRETSAQG